ncbi:MAG: phosphatidylglycerophosphatase A [Acidobacteriota bacterium]
MELSGYLERKLIQSRIGGKAETRPILALWLATGLGLGRLPAAPGTWASIATVALSLGVYQVWPEAAPWLHGGGLVFLFPVAVWAAGRTAAWLEDRDPHCVVVDEVLGQSIALLALPPGWLWCLLALAAFRCFDILKPPPVRQLERIPGGWGIVLDDVMAGVYAWLLVRLLTHAS